MFVLCCAGSDGDCLFRCFYEEAEYENDLLTLFDVMMGICYPNVVHCFPLCVLLLVASISPSVLTLKRLAATTSLVHIGMPGQYFTDGLTSKYLLLSYCIVQFISQTSLDGGGS